VQFGHKTITVQERSELPFVRRRLESVQPPKPFKAEYEGSVPFTRSRVSALAVIVPLDKRADALSDKCPSFVPAAQGQARCARMANGARSSMLAAEQLPCYHIRIMRRSPLSSQNAPLQQRRRVVGKVPRRRLPVVLTDRPVAWLQVVNCAGAKVES